ncbi:DUF3515 domain-containing protein [Curtobacterium sp. MCBD17_019]|nr:DUF3515 domain-containing protein [Curtobacterium sp. MCBD17_019]
MAMHSSRRLPRALGAIALAVGLVAALEGCADAVTLTPAPAANSAACAAVQVRLPTTVESKLAIRATNAQSTAVWGTPAAVVLHCGVPVPTVSDLPCFTLGSVDWIRDARKDSIVYTTFGRSPAVQVALDPTAATSDVLQDIGDAVSTLPKDGHACLDPSDVATPSAPATPSASATPAG